MTSNRRTKHFVKLTTIQVECTINALVAYSNKLHTELREYQEKYSSAPTIPSDVFLEYYALVKSLEAIERQLITFCNLLEPDDRTRQILYIARTNLGLVSKNLEVIRQELKHDSTVKAN